MIKTLINVDYYYFDVLCKCNIKEEEEEEEEEEEREFDFLYERYCWLSMLCFYCIHEDTQYDIQPHLFSMIMFSFLFNCNTL